MLQNSRRGEVAYLALPLFPGRLMGRSQLFRDRYSGDRGGASLLSLSHLGHLAPDQNATVVHSAFGVALPLR